jgi:hypothetical protein
MTSASGCPAASDRATLTRRLVRPGRKMARGNQGQHGRRSPAVRNAQRRRVSQTEPSASGCMILAVELFRLVSDDRTTHRGSLASSLSESVSDSVSLPGS